MTVPSSGYSIVDASDPDRDQRIRAVEAILGDLGLAEKPRLLVWNKVDRLEATDAEHLERHGDGFVISALDRATFGPLLLAVERALWRSGKDTPVARALHA